MTIKVDALAQALVDARLETVNSTSVERWEMRQKADAWDRDLARRIIRHYNHLIADE